MLTHAGRWMTRLSETVPFTNVVGLARSLLALGTLLTLLGNSSATLFLPTGDGPSAPLCTGAARYGLFCTAEPHTEVARWIAVTILITVISGWWPRWTALPHAYVAFSVHNSITVGDGGDQVALVLSVLLVPLLFCDGRRNHWHAPPPVTGEGRRAAAFIGLAALLMIKIQMAVIYFNAGVAKLGVTQWADGTAMYYWITDPRFGAPPWLSWLFEPILTHGFTVALFTWSVIVGEILLSAGIFMPHRAQKYLLAAAIAFHVGIALVIGLVSFAFAMIAGCLLYLRRVDDTFDIAALTARLGRLGAPRRLSLDPPSDSW